MIEQVRVERAVAHAATRHALWPTGARLVVAVSGGPDSLCLLGALHALRERGSRVAPSVILVAHLDHGLRGKNGARDAAWVADFAAKLGVECIVEHADVGDVSRQQHRSLEDTARRVRYAFLRRVAADTDADRICVGHTLDDQAETVVMHFLRGSGIAGLAGMAFLQSDIARPLLGLTRADTTAYCADRGWAPRIDPTNADPAFMRNRIRTYLLPMLREYNPNLHQTLARNAALLSDDERLLEALASAEWERVLMGQEPDAVALARRPVRDLPPALRHRIYRRAAAYLAGEERHWEASGILAVDDLLDDNSSGGSLDLPAGLRAHISYTTLVFERPSARQSQHETAPRAPKTDIPVGRLRELGGTAREVAQQLLAPGVLDLPEMGWRLRSWLTELPAGLDPAGTPPAPLTVLANAGLAGELERSETRVSLDADAAGVELTVRTWRAGDRFRPLGMEHEKKVSDVFIDAKVPRSLRHRLPLVFAGDRLIWLAGVRIDDRVRITPQTRRVLALQLEPLESAGSGEPLTS
jgi:tRNA(Ile)-lysidine synthase